MKKLTSILFTLSIITNNGFASYVNTGNFDPTITFVEALQLNIEQMPITNAVGGDDIESVCQITITHDPNRSVSCTLSSNSVTLTNQNSHSFVLPMSIDGCNDFTMGSPSSILPVDAQNNTTYQGTVIVTTTYDSSSEGE